MAEASEQRVLSPVPVDIHTANLVGNIMIVVGGSDGRQTFSRYLLLELRYMEICHSLIRCGTDVNVFRYLPLEYDTRGETLPTACAYVHANRIIFVHNGRVMTDRSTQMTYFFSIWVCQHVSLRYPFDLLT